jgi:phage tail-like protein
VLSDIETTFDPRRTPDAFVPFLAHWVGLERIFDERPNGMASSSAPYVPMTSGLGPLRDLIATATHLSQWRGTKKGLRLFLEMATGIAGFDIDEHVIGADGEPRQFHIHIWAPEATRPHRPLIERIIAQEKPAHITYALDFRSRHAGEM